MRLTFLGKETQGGGSPTLFATDRGTYVVQGWKVAGQSDDNIEIPQRLLAHLEPHTYLGATLSDSGRGTFFLSGAPVTDAEALSRMDIPGHEASVEVPKHKEVWFGEPATGRGV
ncbi:hypothetical protein [Kibdelosporangium philippinense]